MVSASHPDGNRVCGRCTEVRYNFSQRTPRLSLEIFDFGTGRHVGQVVRHGGVELHDEDRGAVRRRAQKVAEEPVVAAVDVDRDEVLEFVIPLRSNADN